MITLASLLIGFLLFSTFCSIIISFFCIPYYQWFHLLFSQQFNEFLNDKIKLGRFINKNYHRF
jgi:hypothetical protein